MSRQHCTIVVSFYTNHYADHYDLSELASDLGNAVLDKYDAENLSIDTAVRKEPKQ